MEKRELEFKFPLNKEGGMDYLTEHMKRLAKKFIEDSKPENLPIEFKDIKPDRLITLLYEQATPILRKLEDDAILAGVEKTAALIRERRRLRGNKEV